MKIEAAGTSSLPTAAKLVGAAVMCAVCWAITDVIMFRHAEYQEPGLNHFFFAAVGAFVGWSYIGKRAEQGYKAAWGAGISGALVAVFWIILLSACYGIYKGIGYHAYKSVPEMVEGFMKLCGEYIMLLTDIQLLILVLAGGLLTGIFAGFAGRLWR